MKKSIILIKKNSYILNGKEYDLEMISEINHLLKPNIKIIILEEDLYVKQFNNKVKKYSLAEFVNNKINNDFPQNGDILYDHDFNKKNNIVFIYSIRGAKRIEKLADYVKNIEVKPIQFIIKEIMVKNLKNKNFSAKVLIKYDEVFYFICFKGGLFDYGFIEEDEEEILNKIISNNEVKEIFVDKDIVNILSNENKINIINMNIGELINEKIYKKQRFHTGKVL